MRNTIRHLLPKSDQWALDNDRPFSRFMRGIADFLDDSRAKVDEVLLEFFPAFSSDPYTQLARLGVAAQYTAPLSLERARALLGIMRETPTDMSPGRLQRILRTLWPSITVHEWWASEGPYVARDPLTYIVQPQTGNTRCGVTAARCGVESARCERFLINDPNYLVNGRLVDNPPPGYTANPEGVIYLSGSSIGTSALVPDDERDLLEVLILKLSRGTNWVVLLVDYSVPGALVTEGGATLLTTEDGVQITVEK